MRVTAVEVLGKVGSLDWDGLLARTGGNAREQSSTFSVNKRRCMINLDHTGGRHLHDLEDILRHNSDAVEDLGHRRLQLLLSRPHNSIRGEACHLARRGPLAVLR